MSTKIKFYDGCKVYMVVDPSAFLEGPEGDAPLPEEVRSHLIKATAKYVVAAGRLNRAGQAGGILLVDGDFNPEPFRAGISLLGGDPDEEIEAASHRLARRASRDP